MDEGIDKTLNLQLSFSLQHTSSQLLAVKQPTALKALQYCVNCYQSSFHVEVANYGQAPLEKQQNDDDDDAGRRLKSDTSSHDSNQTASKNH
jgi:hypothetical protein